MDVELSALERMPQVCLQLHPLDDGVAHVRLEHLKAAFPARLRRVHRDVRVAQQVFGAGVRGLAEGDPDARTRRDLHLVDLERRLQPRADPFRDRDGRPLVVEVVEQDRELVPREARERVARAHARPEPRRDADEQLVAGSVPEAVVDGLEVVEVEQQDRDRLGARVATPGERRRDAVGEERAVGEIGERVVERLMGDRLERLPVGRVAHEGVHALRPVTQGHPHAQLDGELDAVPPDRVDLERPVDDRAPAGPDEPCERAAMRLAGRLGDDRRDERQPDRLLARPAERLLGLAVPLDDPSVGAHADERVARSLDHRTEPLLACA